MIIRVSGTDVDYVVDSTRKRANARGLDLCCTFITECSIWNILGFVPLFLFASTSPMFAYIWFASRFANSIVRRQRSNACIQLKFINSETVAKPYSIRSNNFVSNGPFEYGGKTWNRWSNVFFFFLFYIFLVGGIGTTTAYAALFFNFHGNMVNFRTSWHTTNSN